MKSNTPPPSPDNQAPASTEKTSTQMQPVKPFINRRKGRDRRDDNDPCRDLPVDLYHRKRRKSKDRRANRTLLEDYYAYISSRKPDNDQG